MHYLTKTIYLACLITITFIASCSSVPEQQIRKDNEPYIVSNERNDIKAEHPELWKWISSEGKKIRNREQTEIESLDYSALLNKARNIAQSELGRQQNLLVAGKWLECKVQKYTQYKKSEEFSKKHELKTRGEGIFIEFNLDGTYKKYNRYFDALDCSGDPQPLFGNYELLGYYLVGEDMVLKDGTLVKELDLFDLDAAEPNLKKEQKAYFTVVQIMEDSLLFGYRMSPGSRLTPSSRPKRLDREELRFIKVTE